MFCLSCGYEDARTSVGGGCFDCGSAKLVSNDEGEAIREIAEREREIAEKERNEPKSAYEQVVRQRAEEAERLIQQSSAIEVLSIDTYPGRDVKKVLGTICGIGDRQTNGLFSFKTEKAIYEKGFESAMSALKISAFKLGANAVLGMQININTSSPVSSAAGSTKGVDTVTLIGTAVELG